MLFNDSENVEVRETDIKGKSLFTKHDFKKGDIVLIASGKIVTHATDYTIPIGDILKIDPQDPGSLSQFICHSCEPNVGIKNRNLFIAMRDIKRGEEVLTNYAFLGYEYGHESKQNGNEKLSIDLTCCCGENNCNGKLQCYKNMPPEWRLKYREYISDYLLDDIKYPYISN